MSIFKSLGAAAALAMVAPITANAATSLLESITLDFGTGPGQIGALPADTSIIGANVPTANSVLVEDVNKNANSVRANFDFVSDFTATTIDRFVVTLMIAGVSDLAPALNANGRAADGSDPVGELWWAEIRGATAGTSDSYYKRLPSTQTLDNSNPPVIQDTPITFSFTLDATNDGGEAGSDRLDGIANTAFTTSVTQERIRLRFREESALADGFELLSARVDVYEVAAPVPVPASGLLLLGAVGGVAAWKRRKTAS